MSKKQTGKNTRRGEGGLITASDVAERAGVSMMTVSRVLSGSGYASATTRKKVLEAAQTLGYTPSISAKVLRGTRTNVVGMLVTELSSAYIGQVISAVSAATKKAKIDLFIALAGADADDASPGPLAHMLNGICDGLLLALPKTPINNLELIERSNVPAVLLNYCRSTTQLAIVRGENYEVSRSAVRHLIELGHRHIAFIAGSHYTGQSQERQRGYSDALLEAEIKVNTALIVPGEYDRTVAFTKTQELLARRDRPTAIFAASDDMALGALDAAKVCGLRVPEDLSIVGFDDLPAVSQSSPPLTTVRQPIDRIAETAVRTLLLQIETGTRASERIELPSELVVRASSGIAPKMAAHPAKATRRKET
ncbi:LacI family DNA-binding transcriptional regulator [Curvibacter sp. CHRR-16]|uniref:LacI family DNA-binding transcriptional regulator n=1 Tax=Curvibacter sp. CHRR-16 TaxID=2835872 RepID=UPI001BD92BD9|nr:LacI family DNA-binding transcriptional regulator [Curvibacter sp. CHRR-16]MBT0569937.1 LacI family DNA-binding transcriptional regulator [Curvibacter sp. CHRR-16]